MLSLSSCVSYTSQLECAGSHILQQGRLAAPHRPFPPDQLARLLQFAADTSAAVCGRHSGLLVSIYCSRYAEPGPHKRRHEPLLQLCSQTRLGMPTWRAPSSSSTRQGGRQHTVMPPAPCLFVNQQCLLSGTCLPHRVSHRQPSQRSAAQRGSAQAAWRSAAQPSTAQRSTGGSPVQCPATTRAGARASMSCIVGSILGARSRGARWKPGAAHSTAHSRRTQCRGRLTATQQWHCARLAACSHSGAQGGRAVLLTSKHSVGPLACLLLHVSHHIHNA